MDVERAQVVPILISGFGRSGTTAIMALLGTDDSVAFDRIYPYEIRYLTFLIKQSMLANRKHPGTVHDAFRMCDSNLDSGSGPPWHPLTDTLVHLSDILSPQELWSQFVKRVQTTAPQATHYAEKAPFWLADQLREVTPVRVIHLVRDPRDVYLSVRAFAHSTGQLESHGLAGDFEPDQARDMAYQLASFSEAAHADRGRDDAVVLRYDEWSSNLADTAAHLGSWLKLNFNANSPSITSHLGKHRTTKDMASSRGRWQREPVPTVVGDYLLPALGSYGSDYDYDLPKPRSDIALDPRRPHSADADWSTTARGIRLQLTGSDAWIELLDEPLAADNVGEIWICLRANVGDINSAYWCRNEADFSESRAVHVPFNPGPHVQIVRLAVGKHRKWKDTISRLRIDICNGPVMLGDAVEVFWVRLVR
jgi:hypothetical protein